MLTAVQLGIGTRIGFALVRMLMRTPVVQNMLRVMRCVEQGGVIIRFVRVSQSHVGLMTHTNALTRRHAHTHAAIPRARTHAQTYMRTDTHTHTDMPWQNRTHARPRIPARAYPRTHANTHAHADA